MFLNNNDDSGLLWSHPDFLVEIVLNSPPWVEAWQSTVMTEEEWVWLGERTVALVRNVIWDELGCVMHELQQEARRAVFGIADR
jgi:hypothetical protein